MANLSYLRYQIIIAYLMLFSCSSYTIERDYISWIGFEPREVEKKMIESLQTARSSLHIAWYSFDNEAIAASLAEVSTRVPVQAITAYNSEHSDAWKKLRATGNVSLLAGNQNGLMHNKYAIIDREIVITGSANFSADFPKHFNVTTIIRSPKIAEQFLMDFSVLQNQFFGAEKSEGFHDLKFASHSDSPFFQEKIPLGETIASVFFTPYRSLYPSYRISTASSQMPLCQSMCTSSVPASRLEKNCDACLHDSCLIPKERGIIYRFAEWKKNTPEIVCRRYDNAFNVILPQIRAAKKEILILAFSLRDSLFIDRLVEAKSRGVRVLVYIDHSQYRSALHSVGETYQQMARQGLEVYITQRFDGGLLHHKTILIDRERLIIGSLNFSQSAVTINDENFLILENAGHLAPSILHETRSIHQQSWLLTDRPKRIILDAPNP